MTNKKINPWRTRVVVLSQLLFFVTVPHTLEDFVLGEPASHQVPVTVLAGVVAGLFALQGLGLFLVGGDQRSGYAIHLGLGLLWPLAAGSAQLPTILAGPVYRSGFISLFYVFGMMTLGILLFLGSFLSLRDATK